MGTKKFKVFLAESGAITPLLSYGAGNGPSMSDVFGCKLVAFSPDEGLTIPDGATEEYVKTIPFGIDMTNYIGILLDVTGYDSSDAPKSMMNSMRSGGLYGSTSYPMLFISKDYTKSRIYGETVAFDGGYKVNLMYQDAIATDDNGMFLGKYTAAGANKAPIPVASGSNTNSRLVSAHISGNNLVLKYKKAGATSGILFTSGLNLAYFPI